MTSLPFSTGYNAAPPDDSLLFYTQIMKEC